jgi:Tol biopolymer transport system component
MTPIASAQVSAPNPNLVSVNSAEKVGNNISGRSARPVTSSHGTIVAFDSIASNLVGSDTNRSDDVFVRDIATGVTERVSVSSAGEQADGTSSRPDISGDGRFVAFDSTADNLVPGDTHPSFDVFVRDRESATTTLVSEAFGGGPADGPSSSPVISRNGRFVAFTSDATNLTRKPSAGSVFVRNLRTGHTTVASVLLDGSPASASAPSLSANGRYVAFSSFVAGFVPGDTNGTFDVFVRDRRQHTTTRVSVDSGGAEASGGSFQPAISAHGGRVAFASDATNLVSDDTNGVQDIFVHEVATGSTVRVNLASDGTQANEQSNGPGIRGGTTFGPDISANGRYVTFDSIATNLVANDTNTCEYPPGGPSFTIPGECPDVFVHDLQTGSTVRVSVDASGTQANDASTDPSISGDGSSVVFFSAAAFVATDTNTCQPFFLGHAGQCPDIYQHSR